MASSVVPVRCAIWRSENPSDLAFLGYSYVSEKPALQEILPRIPITARLAVLALLFSVVLGVPLGVISAVRQNTGLDYFLRVLSLSGLSLPSFWLGLLILMASVQWFGMIPIYTNEPRSMIDELLLLSSWFRQHPGELARAVRADGARGIVLADSA